MSSTLTTISLSNGREVDTVHDVRTIDAMMTGAIQQGKIIVVLPTITGEAHLLATQIVGWWPKSSVAARSGAGATANAGAAGGTGRKKRR